MASKKTEVFVYLREIPGVKKYWGWFLVLGILLIALGLLAIGYANWATEFTILLLGFVLGTAGLIQIINGFYAARWTGFSVSLLLGLLYIIAGGFCILKPMQSALSISLLIALLLLVGGTFRLISALSHRFDRWGLMVFNGAIAILLGILILAEWPASAIWVIGLFVGIDLLIMGWYWVWLSLIARKRG